MFEEPRVKWIILPGTPVLLQYGHTLQATKALTGRLPGFTSPLQFPSSPDPMSKETFPLGRGSLYRCTRERLIHPSDNKKWALPPLILPGSPYPKPYPTYLLPHFFWIGILPGQVLCSPLHLQLACICLFYMYNAILFLPHLHNVQIHFSSGFCVFTIFFIKNS